MLVSGSAFVGTNSFAALGGGGAAGVGSGGGKVTFAKKKLVKPTKAPTAAVVVDDWEAAEAAEEERENPSIASVDADSASAAPAAVEPVSAELADPAAVAVVELQNTSTSDHHEGQVPSAAPVTHQAAESDAIESAAAVDPEVAMPLGSQVVANAEKNIDVEEGEEDPSGSHGVRLDAA
jgi:transcriptional repressor NF-X1